MDVFPKFIIETDEELGDCLIIAKCTYHKQLVTFPEKVKGGGWWKKTDAETFCLYGSSEDFGTAQLEDIKACVLSGNVFTNSSLRNSIAHEFKFLYDTGSESIRLFTTIADGNLIITEPLSVIGKFKASEYEAEKNINALKK